MSMHEEIRTSISKDAGYRAGYQAGIKHAWDLIDQAAEFYDKTSKLFEQDNPAKAEHNRDRKMALLYAQQLITMNKFKPETHGHV